MNIRRFKGKIIISVILILLFTMCIAPITSLAEDLDLSKYRYRGCKI